MSEALQKEIGRRRTFAIISHPDAGKTTLTEKLLLYGGAVQLAGSVKARKSQRATTSDWMELEKKRGISISSTVLQFDYEESRINLLDTPGHKDFSEDTYRVLTAVDAVVMVIDAGKGIETQTRKLFEVCRNRQIPIFTFMNKCDRPTLDPLALLDDVERTLQIGTFAVNWPIGNGVDFKGVYDRMEKQVHLFERTVGGAFVAPVSIGSFSDESIRKRLDPDLYSKVTEELGILDLAGEEFDTREVLSGGVTPVFFGSAMNNFGVQLLLDGFLKHAPEPQPRRSGERVIDPASDAFSAFVFKIQANMDPRHRDRIAFMRICSGKFERDMMAFHSRTGKEIRLSNSSKLFGRERETVDDACAGDIVGLVGHSEFGIGDTISADATIQYHEIPMFPPECFAFLHNPNTGKYKQFRQGLDQLLQEGVIQVFHLKDSVTKVPLLGAVGPLQFEVVQYRLESEYGATSRLEQSNWNQIRWLPVEFAAEQWQACRLPSGAKIAWDQRDRPVALFTSDWSMNYFMESNPSVSLARLPSALIES